MASSKITTAQVVDAMVTSGHAEYAARNAAQVSVDTFTTSAILTMRALTSGVTALSIADGCKAAVAADRTLHRLVYTSSATVGTHARAGRVLSLAGKLPENIGPRDVQAMIHKLPTGVVDAIIDSRKIDSQSAAAAALVSAVKAKASADKRTADAMNGKAKGTDDAPTTDLSDDDAPTTDAPTADAATLLREARVKITAALSAGPLTGDALALVKIIADTLGDALDTVPADAFALVTAGG